MNECLIDFEAYPKCPEIGYDPEWDDSPFFDFDALYDKERKYRIAALALVMRQRLLTDLEEIEAVKLGHELTNYNKEDLNDVWFQQRRLQMLARGINVS